MSVFAAILLPAIAMVGVIALDFTNLARNKSMLQAATDAAAISAVKELRFAEGVPDIDLNAHLMHIARGVIEANVNDDSLQIAVDVTLLDDSTVQVDAQSDVPLLFASALDADAAHLQAEAVAQIFGGEDVCAVALNQADQYTLDLNNDASITGPGCTIYSNSTHARGLAISDSAFIEASHICSAGGAQGMASSFRPQAMTDCPMLKDPMAHKLDLIAAVADGPCVDTGPTIFDGMGEETLAPGRYCNDVSVVGDVVLALSPGIFVFDDAMFSAAGLSTVKGKDIAMVFTGQDSRLVIDGEAEIRLSGRVSGDMAGMLMMSEPRTDGTMREFTIYSPNVHELVGTVYLPGDYLNVLTSNNVAADSAFTVVMAKRIKLHGSASLVLNRDYATTTVPKSTGLSDYGGGSRLVR